MTIQRRKKNSTETVPEKYLMAYLQDKDLKKKKRTVKDSLKRYSKN